MDAVAAGQPLAVATKPSELARLRDATERVAPGPLITLLFTPRGMQALMSAMRRVIGRLPHPQELAWVYRDVARRDMEVADTTVVFVHRDGGIQDADAQRWAAAGLPGVRAAHGLMYAWARVDAGACTVKLVGPSTLDESAKARAVQLMSSAADAVVKAAPEGWATLTRFARRGVPPADTAGIQASLSWPERPAPADA